MAWDPVWEDVFKNNEWGRYPGEDVVRFVARNYYRRERPAVKILEVGCGPGANIWYIAREGFAAYGIDGSATAIARCRQRLAAEGLTATLHVGDIADLPYPDDMFDAVLDVECLCCNDRKTSAAIIAEIKRVLKPKGKFYSRTFSDDMFVGRSPQNVADLEYCTVNEGPLEGKGFVRLTDRKTIDDLYGSMLPIETIERASHTRDNEHQHIVEWQITCVKSS